MTLDAVQSNPFLPHIANENLWQLLGYPSEQAWIDAGRPNTAPASTKPSAFTAPGLAPSAPLPPPAYKEPAGPPAPAAPTFSSTATATPGTQAIAPGTPANQIQQVGGPAQATSSAVASMPPVGLSTPQPQQIKPPSLPGAGLASPFDQANILPVNTLPTDNQNRQLSQTQSVDSLTASLPPDVKRNLIDVYNQEVSGGASPGTAFQHLYNKVMDLQGNAKAVGPLAQPLDFSSPKAAFGTTLGVTTGLQQMAGEGLSTIARPATQALRGVPVIGNTLSTASDQALRLAPYFINPLAGGEGLASSGKQLLGAVGLGEGLQGLHNVTGEPFGRGTGQLFGGLVAPAAEGGIRNVISNIKGQGPQDLTQGAKAATSEFTPEELNTLTTGRGSGGSLIRQALPNNATVEFRRYPDGAINVDFQGSPGVSGLNVLKNKIESLRTALPDATIRVEGATSRLTNVYKRMGFTDVGGVAGGQPMLELRPGESLAGKAASVTPAAQAATGAIMPRRVAFLRSPDEVPGGTGIDTYYLSPKGELISGTSLESHADIAQRAGFPTGQAALDAGYTRMGVGNGTVLVEGMNPKAVLVAARSVPPDTEIFWDIGNLKFENGALKGAMSGSATARDVIRGASSLGDLNAASATLKAAQETGLATNPELRGSTPAPTTLPSSTIPGLAESASMTPEQLRANTAASSAAATTTLADLKKQATEFGLPTVAKGKAKTAAQLIEDINRYKLGQTAAANPVTEGPTSQLLTEMGHPPGATPTVPSNAASEAQRLQDFAASRGVAPPSASVAAAPTASTGFQPVTGPSTPKTTIEGTVLNPTQETPDAFTQFMEQQGKAYPPSVATGSTGGPPPPPTELPLGTSGGGDLPRNLKGIGLSDQGNAIIAQYRDAFLNKMQPELTAEPKISNFRKITSTIGGDLQDPYLAEIVNTERSVNQQLAKNLIDSIPQVNLDGMTPKEAQSWQIEQMTAKQQALRQASDATKALRADLLQQHYTGSALRHAEVILQSNDLRAAALGRGFLGGLSKAQQMLKAWRFGLDYGIVLQQNLKALRTGGTSFASGLGYRAVDKIGQAFGKPDDWLGVYQNPNVSHEVERASYGLIEQGAGAVGLETPQAGNLAAKAYRGLQNAQYGPLQKAREIMWEGRVFQNKMLGLPTDAAAKSQISDFVNMATSTAKTATEAGRNLAEKSVLLSPQLTRSQWAELAQPLKSFSSTTQALSTVNQVISTAATFGMAYELNKILGQPISLQDFMKTVANPMNSGFGKLTLKATDDKGHHIVWNFLPQFSTENAILRSLRETQKLAKGGPNAPSAKQALAYLGDTAAKYGFGRLNVGIQGGLDLSGVGYGSDGTFHYGDMPLAQRAIAAAPVPLSATQAAQSGTSPWKSPVGFGMNVLGGNTYPEPKTSLENRYSQQLYSQSYNNLNSLQQANVNVEAKQAGEAVSSSTAIRPWWTAGYEDTWALVKDLGQLPDAGPTLKMAAKYKDLQAFMDAVSAAGKKDNLQYADQTQMQQQFATMLDKELRQATGGDDFAAIQRRLRTIALQKDPSIYDAVQSYYQANGYTVPQWLIDWHNKQAQQ